MPAIIQSDRRAREKPCVRCGYSLRNLPDARQCPECGLAMWLSLGARWALEMSNPEWMRRLRTGTWMMASSQVIILAAFFVPMVPLDGDAARPFLAAALVGLYLLTYHAGLLLLCVHEGRYPDRLAGNRIVNRIIAGVAMVVGLLFLWRAVSGAVGTEAQPWPVALDILLGVSAIGSLAHLRKLARRIPSRAMARLTGCMLIAPGLMLVASVPFYSIVLPVEVIDVLPWVPVIYYPVTAGLLALYALAFTDAARSAERLWTSETAC